MDSHSRVNTWVVPTPGQQNMPTGLIDFANIPNFADMTNPDPYPLRNTGPAGSGLRTDTFSTSTEPFYSNLNYDFQGFRGQVLPSDPGTVPEGSIHESQLHGTASVASHYGDDQSPETQQARDMFGTLALGQQQQQQPAGQPVIKRSSSVASSSKVSKVSKLKCPGCNTVCKTNSELSKHNQRHAKSFLCGVNGCERKGGFGTLNDLNRHKKSVHNIGGGPIYACTENPCGRLAAGKPRKTFARADNFRSHLRKLHNMDLSTEDLAKYHYYPAPEERAQMEAESNLETLDEEGSFIDGYIIEADDVLDDMTSERPEDDYVMSDFQSVPQMQPTEQQVISMEASASLTESGMLAQGTQFDQVFVNPSVFMPGEDINLNFGDQPNNDADNSDGVFAAGQWQAPEPLEQSDSLSPDLSVPFPNASFGPLGTTGISDAEDTEDGTDRVAADESPSHLKSFDELVSDGVTTPAIVAFLRTVPRNLLEMALSGNVSISVTDSQSQPAKAGSRCPTCNKLFQRQCELKKHMKRHEKPYVCTFKGCVNRRFGSKNDWKRHESSQHDTAEQQKQSWVCRDPRCASKVHLFPSALAYREHLFATHKIRDEATIHAKLVEGVFGGRQDRYFWCGFCAKVMDGGSSSDSSSGPWNARCDHIDFHFSGKDMYAAAKFKDWKYLEDQAGMEEVLKASQGQQAMGPPPPTSSFSSSLGGSFASVARSDTSEDTTSTLASNARKRKVAGPHTSRSRGSRRNGM